jgi:hypothetical protein
VDDLHGRRLAGRRQDIVTERRGDVPPVPVVGDALVKHAAGAQHDRAVQLAVDDLRVDHGARVLDHQVPFDRDAAGHRVDDHLAQVGGVGVRHRRRVVGDLHGEPGFQAHGQRQRVQVGGARGVADRQSGGHPALVLGVHDLAVPDVELLCRAGAEQFAGDGEDLLLEPGSGEQSGATAGCSAAGSAGSHAVGGDLGVAEADGDILGAHAQAGRDRLGDCRLVALPGRRDAGRGHDGATRVDADPG